jgi:3',5'-cyclic AMP phosphodiesterase CpdA
VSTRATARILHVSDLHFGTREDPAMEHALLSLLERTAPELVIATGDLTHRGRRDQHERAARFLRALNLPLLAIPGNHDIPYTFPARFTSTWTEFLREWSTTEPVYHANGVYVVGLNSVRAWRHQSGGLRGSQIERACRALSEAPEGVIRVVALHHHLLGAPWRSTKKPVARRNRVLAALVDGGAELILAGHIRAVVVSIAPGLGQPRPKRRGEARGLHIYEVGEQTIRVLTYIWRVDDWGLTAERRFPRGRHPLAVTEA